MNTIKEYYDSLASYFIDSPHKINDIDRAVYKKNQQKLDNLAPYFREHLANIWRKFFEYNNKPSGHKHHIDKPRLAAFCGFKLLDEMYLSLQFYKDSDISKKEYTLHRNRELLDEIIKDQNDNVAFRFGEGWYYTTVDSSSRIYPQDISEHPFVWPPTEQNVLTHRYYDLIMKEIDGF